jgi:putative colanic acid biosynthesis acetyltransferase WcaF
MDRNLSLFQNDKSLLHKVQLLAWLVVQNLIFVKFWIPSRTRVKILRLFGARIGRNVILRSNVRVHFPWNLRIGDDCWIGEGSWIINHELVELESNVCISQASVICSSGHNLLSKDLAYKNSPIFISEGAWICLGARILAGASIGKNSVVSAGETFSGNLPENHLFKHQNMYLLTFPDESILS